MLAFALKDKNSESGWITLPNGVKCQVDESGNIVKGPKAVHGENIKELGAFEKSPVASGAEQKQTLTVQEKRQAVNQAIEKIANGSEEETIPNLRNDLEQFGGTNDVTLVRGDKGKGLEHIAARRGAETIPGVLEAVVDGKFVRFSRGNKTVVLRKGNYEAVLSLEEHGKQKTWLLTGFDVTVPKEEKVKDSSGESGKFCPRHASTQTEPMSCRPGLGADESLIKNIAQIFDQASPARSSTMQFYSVSQISENMHQMADGSILCVGVPIGRCGVQTYAAQELPGVTPGPDGLIQVERPEDEVFSDASMATFEGGTMVIYHPEEDVTPDNWRELATGHAQNIRRGKGDDSDLLLADLLIKAQEGIDAINSGMRDISLGYDAEYVEAGPGRGSQKNIVGNHIALVDQARAGSRVRIRDHSIKTKESQIMQVKKTASGGIGAKLCQLLRLKLKDQDLPPEVVEDVIEVAEAAAAEAAVEAITTSETDVVTATDQVEPDGDINGRLDRLEMSVRQIMELLSAASDGTADEAPPQQMQDDDGEDQPTGTVIKTGDQQNQRIKTADADLVGMAQAINPSFRFQIGDNADAVMSLALTSPGANQVARNTANSILNGKAWRDASPELKRAAFTAAWEIARHSNNLKTGAALTGSFADSASYGPKTPDEVQEINNKHYKKGY